ncbi:MULTISPECIES: helix-turn-helix transcriptional regulator [Bacillus]|uniref:helix-turn-helix transcriptional regulator n=1 Tax=Bacillus TaxID=1386 RepID=UPI0001A0EFB2|nr:MULTISPECIES: helix-turn-helix transcriptional regulator [Bacillus]EEL52753.1 Helix-turn-helix domain protein [Bacillus cereus Rock4-2]KAF6688239.1 helix-turn-helix domain-containing protein [Bacillus sp. EKM501B]MEB9547410.1 helix-turn-helix transcriptional regulator [Bacillus cereus]MEB9833439.1 helix-turn-helix transcriptional regulator [Bacillus cereus]PEA99467.1 XRE family transcriptional regulator [Bacillus cereus]
MNNKTRREALSAFLKTKRAQISPESIGLPAGTRRRTPGLRREEVAQLAGVSTTWYTWLEQGRDIKVSTIVLDCISKALQLNNDETDYLYDLAFESNSEITIPKKDQSKLSPSLIRILDELTYCPTIITDRHFHIVGWNLAAAYVFLDFEQIPNDQRNLIHLVFTRKELKALAVNWEHFVKGFLAIFRTYYGRYLDDEWYSQFIKEMSHSHSEFQGLWQESQVSKAPDMIIEFRHAKAGKMLFNLTSLQVQGDMDLRCSIYTPVEETDTENKLKGLMKRASSEN